MEAVSSTAAISQAKFETELSVRTFKLALDSQASAAKQLIDTIPKASSYNNPPNLGQSIDTRA
jgi:hypothetical protein